jgi:tetratricopeptide (TPR) repeat protein
MQKTDKQRMPGTCVTSRALFAAVTLGLGFLAGCTTGAKVPPPVIVEAATPVVEEVTTVARLGDGREGFVIQEVPGSDSESANDFERAVVMMQAGDYASASTVLEKVIERTPGVTAPYINLAIACRHNGKPELAEQHLQKALQLIPAHPVASNEYGLLLRKAGRFAEARAIYEKTLSTFPDYSPAHKNLGILCDIYMKDLACALEHYESYSEAVPKDEQVKLWVADLRVRLGR